MKIGLCENCQHVKKVTSNRGSTFYLCMISQIDSEYKKYPPLPVTACKKYTKKETM